MITFGDPQVQSVFAEYDARAQEERARMGMVGFEGRDNYLLPIGQDVGRFLHSLILARRPGRIIEVGTSYGYSTLFLADAARTVGAKLTTIEVIESKQDFARIKMGEAGLIDHIDFRLGDAIEVITVDPGPFDFVLLDIWKDLYVRCFEALYPKLSNEGIIATDNMIKPAGVLENARAYRKAVMAKADLQTTLLSIGSGIELTCRWSEHSDKL